MGNDYLESDRLLIEGCARKEARAWDVLAAKYSPLMRIAASRRLKKHGVSLPDHDIEDIVQDAIVSIWMDGKISSVKNSGSLPYWLGMVAQNAAFSYVRKARREGIREDFPDTETGSLACLFPWLEQFTSDPRLEASGSELAEAVDKAISSLPAGERLVIKLNIFHNKKHREISSMLGMPQGTVSCFAKRAKEKLRMAVREFLTFFAIILPFLASYIVRGQK